jgi:hypothetical protein
VPPLTNAAKKNREEQKNIVIKDDYSFAVDAEYLRTKKFGKCG